MLKLQNLEGRSWPLLPGPAVSTWWQELVFTCKAEESSFPIDHSAAVVEKASVSPQFQFKGSEATQLLGGQSHLVTSLAHEDTVEGRDKADPPFWQTGQRKGKGKSTKEVKSGRSRQEQCSIQRSSQHGLPRGPLFPAAAIESSSQPGSQSTQAQGSSGMGYPAALGQPLLRNLKNLKIGVCRERLVLSSGAMVQTINRQIHKPCRKTEKKRGDKNAFEREQGPKVTTCEI